MNRALIYGYFGYANLGDEVILASVLRDLRGRYPNLEAVVTSGDPDRTSELHRVQALPWSDLTGLVEAARGCDLILLGGGGLLHDYWDFDPASVLTAEQNGISVYSGAALLAHLVQRPLAVMAIGVGPLHSEAAREHTRLIFRAAAAASVRDSGSQEIVTALGIEPERVPMTADPAYRFPPPGAPPREAGERPRLGVILRQWDLAEGDERWERAVARGLDLFLADQPMDVSFFPFQTLDAHLSDDQVVSRRVAGMMEEGNGDVEVLPSWTTPEDAVRRIGGFDLVLTMRLHGAILAAQHGVPTVALSYDPKVASNMSLLASPELLLDLPGLRGELVAQRLHHAWQTRHETAQVVEAEVSRLRELARENVSRVVERALERGPTTDPDTLRRLNAFTLERVLERHRFRQQVLKEEERISDKELKVLLKEHSVYLAERNFYRREREGMQRQLQTAEDELRRTREEKHRLEATVSSLVRTRIHRLANLYWRGRRFFGRTGRRALRRGFRALPSYLRNRTRRMFRQRGLMSPYAFVFETFRRRRQQVFQRDLGAVRCPTRDGLVSVILPVYNGADMVEEALDSILAQTYESFEVVCVNDGSTDGTAEILDAYARKDPRVRVFHQRNRKLPRTLSRGFREARGEFLTWTSDDNRLKPDFLEKMVACLERNPDWDMAYANLDVIDQFGGPLRHSDWYRGYQVPDGSEHIHLPEDVSELNVWPNNYVGAAFLYRDRVAWLLGDYSPIRFTTEDYDYWMRVNELLTLRHADFDDEVYEYRFHPGSLTARDDELGITRSRVKLMVFDDFRRDFALTPVLWVLDEAEGENAVSQMDAVRRKIDEAGHIAVAPGELDAGSLPRMFFPALYLRVVDDPDALAHPPEGLPETALTVAVVAGEGPLPQELTEDWDLAAVLPDRGRDLPRLSGDAYRGWLGFAAAEDLFTALDVRIRSHQVGLIEEEIELGAEATSLPLSVIICTYQRSQHLVKAVAAVAAQSMPADRFELVVVDNNPQDEDLSTEIEELSRTYFADHPDHFRCVLCPFPGLSHARNAGISAARGEVLCFLDDDAIAAPDLLEQLLRTFRDHPTAGVVGGQIILKPPQPEPPVLAEAWKRYWSHFTPGYPRPTEVVHWWEFPWGANWSARRLALLETGGFRTRYGRKGKDFSGGEELIAASLIHRAGWSVVVDPAAKVLHDVEESRYTFHHVRKTISAGTLCHYQAQRDLYLPNESGIFATLKLLLNPAVDKSAERSETLARVRHWFYRREAWFRLLVTQVRDLAFRLRSTESSTDRR